MNESFIDKATLEVSKLLKSHVDSVVYYDDTLHDEIEGILVLNTPKYIIWYKKATMAGSIQPYKYNFTWQD